MPEQPLRKEEIVRGIFENIQDRYDLLDSLISGGRDQSWRKSLIESLGLAGKETVLDCGAGTGKLTKMIHDFCSGCNTISLDITESMFRKSLLPNTEFIVASAERIPLDDASVDAVVSAYLTRNLENVDRYFSEALRVLKPGGTFANLDIYNPTLPVYSQIFALYFYHIVPFFANRATRSTAYTYLANSVRTFFAPSIILRKINEAGFANARMNKMMLGSIVLHTANKPPAH